MSAGDFCLTKENEGKNISPLSRDGCVFCLWKKPVLIE